MPARQILRNCPKALRGPSPRQRAKSLKAGFLARLRARRQADEAFELRRWNAPTTYDPKLNFLEVMGANCLDQRAVGDHMAALRLLEADGEVEVIVHGTKRTSLVSNPFWARRAAAGPQRPNWRVIRSTDTHVQIRLLRPEQP